MTKGQSAAHLSGSQRERPVFCPAHEGKLFHFRENVGDRAAREDWASSHRRHELARTVTKMSNFPRWLAATLPIKAVIVAVVVGFRARGQIEGPFYGIVARDDASCATKSGNENEGRLLKKTKEDLRTALR